MTVARPLVVGIGGTIREGSLTECALRHALARAAEAGAETLLFAGPALDLPPYDPAETSRSGPARRLVEAIRRADGLILASPGYHGSVSGLVKNAIDYVEDLRDDSRIYLSGRAVGLIACAEGVQALGATLAALRAITHSLRGWPTPYAALIQGGSRPFASDGACQDPAVARALGVVAQEVMEFVALRRAAGAAPPGAAGA